MHSPPAALRWRVLRQPAKKQNVARSEGSPRDGTAQALPASQARPALPSPPFRRGLLRTLEVAGLKSPLAMELAGRPWPVTPSCSRGQTPRGWRWGKQAQGKSPACCLALPEEGPLPMCSAHAATPWVCMGGPQRLAGNSAQRHPPRRDPPFLARKACATRSPGGATRRPVALAATPPPLQKSFPRWPQPCQDHEHPSKGNCQEVASAARLKRAVAGRVPCQERALCPFPNAAPGTSRRNSPRAESMAGTTATGAARLFPKWISLSLVAVRLIFHVVQPDIQHFEKNPKWKSQSGAGWGGEGHFTQVFFSSLPGWVREGEKLRQLNSDFFF